MKNRVTYFFLILLCLVSSSCFELFEEVNLKEDGSGTYSFTANFSQSKTKLKSIMLMDKINGHTVPSETEIREEIKELEQLVKQTKGISEFTKKLDFDNFIFVFSCKFDKLEALNTAVKNVRIAKNLQDNTHDNQFGYDKEKNVFYRYFNPTFQEEYEDLNLEDKKIFQGAKVVSICKFEQEVVSVSNSNARVAANKKAIMMQLKAVYIIANKSSIKNSVTLAQ